VPLANSNSNAVSAGHHFKDGGSGDHYNGETGEEVKALFPAMHC
jgi:hypothetical protein